MEIQGVITPAKLLSSPHVLTQQSQLIGGSQQPQQSSSSASRGSSRQINIRSILNSITVGKSNTINNGSSVVGNSAVPAVPSISNYLNRIFTLANAYNESHGVESIGEMKVTLELLTRRVLQAKDIYVQDMDFDRTQKFIKIVNQFAFIFADAGDIDIGCNLLECGLRILNCSNKDRQQQQQQQQAKSSSSSSVMEGSCSSDQLLDNMLQNLASLLVKKGQSMLAKKIFKFCLNRFYAQSVKQFKSDGIAASTTTMATGLLLSASFTARQPSGIQARSRTLKQQQQSTQNNQQFLTPAQLEQRTIRNCILLNNLAATYLAESKTDKTLHISTYVIASMQPLIFEKDGSEDLCFHLSAQEQTQRIMILLNAHLNAGRAMEDIGRLIKNVQEYSTKFLYFEEALKQYANGTRISRLYLVEDKCFLPRFASLLGSLRMEKQENYVHSFQAKTRQHYGQKFFKAPLEQRVTTFLNCLKVDDETKKSSLQQQQYYQTMPTQSNDQKLQYPQTDRPEKRIKKLQPRKGDYFEGSDNSDNLAAVGGGKNGGSLTARIGQTSMTVTARQQIPNKQQANSSSSQKHRSLINFMPMQQTQQIKPATTVLTKIQSDQVKTNRRQQRLPSGVNLQASEQQPQLTEQNNLNTSQMSLTNKIEDSILFSQPYFTQVQTMMQFNSAAEDNEDDDEDEEVIVDDDIYEDNADDDVSSTEAVARAITGNQPKKVATPVAAATKRANQKQQYQQPKQQQQQQQKQQQQIPDNSQIEFGFDQSLIDHHHHQQQQQPSSTIMLSHHMSGVTSPPTPIMVQQAATAVRNSSNKIHGLTQRQSTSQPTLVQFKMNPDSSSNNNTNGVVSPQEIGLPVTPIGQKGHYFSTHGFSRKFPMDSMQGTSQSHNSHETGKHEESLAIHMQQQQQQQQLLQLQLQQHPSLQQSMKGQQYMLIPIDQSQPQNTISSYSSNQVSSPDTVRVSSSKTQTRDETPTSRLNHKNSTSPTSASSNTAQHQEMQKVRQSTPFVGTQATRLLSRPSIEQDCLLTELKRTIDRQSSQIASLEEKVAAAATAAAGTSITQQPRQASPQQQLNQISQLQFQRSSKQQSQPSPQTQPYSSSISSVSNNNNYNQSTPTSAQQFFVSTLSSIAGDFSPLITAPQSLNTPTLSKEMSKFKVIVSSEEQAIAAAAAANEQNVLSQQQQHQSPQPDSSTAIHININKIERQHEGGLQFHRILEEDSYDTSVSPNLRSSVTRSAIFNSRGSHTNLADSKMMISSNYQPSGDSHQPINAITSTHSSLPPLPPPPPIDRLGIVQQQLRHIVNVKDDQKSTLSQPTANERNSYDYSQSLINFKKQTEQQPHIVAVPNKSKKSGNFGDAIQGDSTEEDGYSQSVTGVANMIMAKQLQHQQQQQRQQQLVQQQSQSQNSNMFDNYSPMSATTGPHVTSTVASPPVGGQPRVQSQQYSHQSSNKNVNMNIPQIQEMIGKNQSVSHAWKVTDINDELYRISVDLTTKNIEISAQSLVSQKSLKNQVLTYADLQVMLEYIEYTDVLPINKPLKSICMLEDVLLHFVLPFLTVDQGKVALQSKALGLLNDDETWNEVKFLNSSCAIDFHHLTTNQFRIVLNCEQRNEQLKIEVEMDDLVKDQLFERLESVVGSRNFKSIDIINLAEMIATKTNEAAESPQDDHRNLIINSQQRDAILSKQSSRADEQSSLQQQQQQSNNLCEDGLFGVSEKDLSVFTEKYKQTAPQQVAAESLRIRDVTAFKSFFLASIVRVEQFLREDLGVKDVSLFNLKFPNKVLKLHLSKNVVKKSIEGVISYIQEDQARQVFIVMLHNTYLSHGPNNEMVYAKGKAEMRFDDLWKEYGLQYDTLDAQDKICVCSLISKQFGLYVFDKKLEEDDFERFNVNAIQRKSITVGLAQRILIGPHFYKQLVTMSYVGIEDSPIGIRVTIYDPVLCEEKGMFLTIEDRLYKKSKEELDADNIQSNGQKKRVKKYKDSYSINTSYHLQGILSAFGWNILLDVIQVVEDSVNNIYSIKGPAITSDKTSSIYRLESIIHPQSILSYFTSKLPLRLTHQASSTS